MPRPPKWRRVEYEPRFTSFKPAGVPKWQLEELIISVEEMEAIRLKDLEGHEQEECATRMHISRATFQRILSIARQKVAEALVNGKAIRIEGGNYRLAGANVQCVACNHEFEALPGRNGYGHGHGHERIRCPRCGADFPQK